MKKLILLLFIVIVSCSDKKNNKRLEDKLNTALIELDSVKQLQVSQKKINKKTELKFAAKLDSLTAVRKKNENWLINQYENLHNSVFLVFTQNDSIQATGTSFLVSADGLCVSNYHVFKGMTEGYVKNSDGKWYDIEQILEYNDKKDFIVFKINLDYSITKPLKVASNRTPKIGEKCFAIGNPRMQENTLSEGIVSSIRNEGKTIQMTAEITNGSSGGPLFNQNGEVIGITSSGLGEANINYAINIHELDLERFKKKNTSLNNANYIIEKDKAYFYEDPNASSKASIFLLSGNLVELEKKENGFAYVSHTNQRTKYQSKGWLKLNNISQVRPITSDALRYYKVLKNKAVFYNAPNEYEPTNKFITENEFISARAEKDNFVFVVHSNKSGNRVSGWINKKDVKLVDEITNSKTTNSVEDKTEKEKIQLIKKRFQFINTSGRFEVIKKEYGTSPSEGAIITGYFDGTQLVKIRVTTFNENSKNVKEYYFWQHQFFFLFERHSFFDEPVEYGKGKAAEVIENRYYLADHTLFRWLKNDKSPATVPEIKEINDEFMENNAGIIKIALEHLK